LANDEGPPRDGEVLPPGVDPADGAALSQTFLALVSNYTDRPDLFIAEIEKHDPGFVKRMNDASERDAKELRDARFRFGKVQAYTGMIVAVVAAAGVLAILAMAVWMKSGAGTIIALGVIYAITQGGSVGFSKLVDSVSRWLHQRKESDKKD